ncbi:MAG: hypothetical protein ABGZ53_29835 [Fuerstiella sp.]|nr:hypothetical protein [Fuerstiella sp.]
MSAANALRAEQHRDYLRMLARAQVAPRKIAGMQKRNVYGRWCRLEWSPDSRFVTEASGHKTLKV